MNVKTKYDKKIKKLDAKLADLTERHKKYKEQNVADRKEVSALDDQLMRVKVERDKYRDEADAARELDVVLEHEENLRLRRQRDEARQERKQSKGYNETWQLTAEKWEENAGVADAEVNRLADEVEQLQEEQDRLQQEVERLQGLGDVTEERDFLNDRVSEVEKKYRAEQKRLRELEADLLKCRSEQSKKGDIQQQLIEELVALRAHRDAMHQEIRDNLTTEAATLINQVAAAAGIHPEELEERAETNYPAEPNNIPGEEDDDFYTRTDLWHTRSRVQQMAQEMGSLLIQGRILNDQNETEDEGDNANADGGKKTVKVSRAQLDTRIETLRQQIEGHLRTIGVQQRALSASRGSDDRTGEVKKLRNLIDTLQDQINEQQQRIQQCKFPPSPQEPRNTR